MKRHHEDNPYSSTDSGGGGGGGGGGTASHSVPKRMATRNNIQSNSSNSSFLGGNYSPPSSTASDSSSSSSSSSSQPLILSHPIHCQLCTCPNIDCVIHDRRRSLGLPHELSSTSNPTYGTNNLLLHYAHLERCRRHGQHIHQDTSSP